MEAGDGRAHQIMGYLYHNGTLVPRSKKKALEVWEKGAELGSTECHASIASAPPSCRYAVIVIFIHTNRVYAASPVLTPLKSQALINSLGVALPASCQLPAIATNDFPPYPQSHSSHHSILIPALLTAVKGNANSVARWRRTSILVIDEVWGSGSA